MIAQCCKCYSIRTQGHWFDIGLNAPIRVSHTYCPRCMVEVNRQIEQIQLRSDHLSIYGEVVPDRVETDPAELEKTMLLGE